MELLQIFRNFALQSEQEYMTTEERLAEERLAEARLAEKGLSITQPRVQILSYLMTHHTHPVIDTIYKDLVGNNPTLSRTSVYNTVKTLNAYGLVHILTIDGHQVCVDEDTSPHGHLLCIRCGKVYDVPMQGPKAKGQQPKAKGQQPTANSLLDGNEILEVHQYYKGICKHCLTLKN